MLFLAKHRHSQISICPSSKNRATSKPLLQHTSVMNFCKPRNRPQKATRSTNRSYQCSLHKMLITSPPCFTMIPNRLQTILWSSPNLKLFNLHQQLKRCQLSSQTRLWISNHQSKRKVSLVETSMMEKMTLPIWSNSLIITKEEGRLIIMELKYQLKNKRPSTKVWVGANKRRCRGKINNRHLTLVKLPNSFPT